MKSPGESPRTKECHWFKNVVLILAGIIFGQFVLYGPSLLGTKVLLPLDILALPGVYLPQTPAIAKIEPHDHTHIDLISIVEMSRQFAVQEIKAGRWPRWNPYQYAGVPSLLPRYSPLAILSYLVASPVILAWREMLAAIIAGTGMYLFCRRFLGVSFWPATIICWCYPLTGFFIFWEGFGLAWPVACLPWLLMAVDNTVRRTRFGFLQLSLLTTCVLVSGALDVAAQVLLTSGFFAVCCVVCAYRRSLGFIFLRKTALTLGAAWFLGFLLASPYFLPILEYTRTGARIERRSSGEEERRPVGLAALPQVVLPNMYGSSQSNSFNNFPEGQFNLQESSAAAYSGIIVVLFLAPLSWCSRRHRGVNFFCLWLIFLALSWCFNIPGVVHVMRTPGFNMLSHNRWVFDFSFAILVMAAVGLDLLWRERVIQWRWWFCLPILLISTAGLWCVYRVIFLPEPMATDFTRAIAAGLPIGNVIDANKVHIIQMWFIQNYAVATVLCVLGVLSWLLVGLKKAFGVTSLCAITFVLLADLLWFGYGRAEQCDPALYYPRIPALEQIKKSVPGRIIGFNCLPAPLSVSHGLMDIRGYDAVDPARFIDLMTLAADTNFVSPQYAMVQSFTPQINVKPPDKISFSPILDMFGVRYVISRMAPAPPFHADFHSDDYWVGINDSALPRAFVPRHVETVVDKEARLKKMASPLFNAKEVAYVESAVDLPNFCSGDAQIIEEIPTRILIKVKMETAGLVVLADLWDKGWNAYCNGNSVPIIRANHAIRGVVVPTGESFLEFRYEPASFRLGLFLAALGSSILLVWTMVARRRNNATFPTGH